MSNEKKEKKVQELIRKKPKQKMPSNLEAVFIDGCFTGRKVRDSLPDKIAKTPQEYIKIILNQTSDFKIRYDILIDYIVLKKDDIQLFYEIPNEKVYEIINNISIDDLNFLYDHFAEYSEDKMNPYLSHCESKIKEHPKVKPWMLKNIIKIQEDRKK